MNTSYKMRPGKSYKIITNKENKMSTPIEQKKTDVIELLQKEAAEAKSKYDAANKELERVQKLKELYPDLEITVGRWNKKVYRSASVNPLVTDYEVRFNCGCCHDSPFEVWFYLETNYGKIYSHPSYFVAGERDGRYSLDVNIEDGAKERILKENVNPDVVNKFFSIYENNKRIEDDDSECCGEKGEEIN